MNNPISLTSPQQPITSLPPPEEKDKVDASSDANKKVEPGIVESFVFSGVLGYGAYWITRLSIHYGWLSDGGVGIRPLPYVLAGLAGGALVMTVQLTCKLALNTLGDREKYEKLTDPKASTFDHLRQRTWKLIARMEQIHQNADAVFSRLVNIRTIKELEDQKIPDSELLFLEIARRVFWEQVHITITNGPIPLLATYPFKAMGLVFFGAELFSFNMLMFNNGMGLIMKIAKIYYTARREEDKEKGIEINAADQLLNNYLDFMFKFT